MPSRDHDRALRGVLRVFLRGLAFALLAFAVSCSSSFAAALGGATWFRKEIEPILEEFCSDCHGGGSKKGGVAFDQFKSDTALLENRELWWKAMKMLRAGMMPPKNKPRPTPEQLEQIEKWIKSS